jgi:hypothetical protein
MTTWRRVPATRRPAGRWVKREVSIGTPESEAAPVEAEPAQPAEAVDLTQAAVQQGTSRAAAILMVDAQAILA